MVFRRNAAADIAETPTAPTPTLPRKREREGKVSAVGIKAV